MGLLAGRLAGLWFLAIAISQVWLPPLFLAVLWYAWSPWLTALFAGYVAYIFGPGSRAASACTWRPVLRRWFVWRAFAAYFPARLVKTADLDPAGHYLFVAHPHGVLAVSSWLNFATDATGFTAAFPGIDVRVATLESNFRVPLLREYCLLHGLCGAGRHELKAILGGKQGQSVLLVVGGAAEALLAHPGTFDLVLNARKGFVRLALQSGASLVPVIAYGETNTFRTYIPRPSSRAAAVIRAIKRTCGFSTPLCWGTGLFGGWGFLPLSTPLTTVVGPPLAVERTAHPSDAQVDAVHAQYVGCLQQLWAGTVKQHGEGLRRELSIVL